MKKNAIAFMFVCAVLLGPVALFAQGVPTPVRVFGSLTVDGVKVPAMVGNLYRFEVKDENGNSFNPPAVDEDGLDDDGYYLLDIPIYDESSQPGGARLGQNAVIHVQEDNTALIVESPPNGIFTVERPADAAKILDIVARREGQSNVPPVASAKGPDGPATPGEQVILDGSDSYDPDSQAPLSYLWEQITQAQLELLDKNQAQARFTVPEADPNNNPLTFRLTVTDDGGLSNADEVEVFVSPATNLHPTAVANADPTMAEEGETVTLDASGSSDPDGFIDRYKWRQTGGPDVALSDFDVVAPIFVAPSVGESGALLSFELTVWDNEGLSDTDVVDIAVQDKYIAPYPDDPDDIIDTDYHNNSGDTNNCFISSVAP